MRLPAQISGASIVALGHFNPLIFRPDWFMGKQIVVGSDADGTEINVIHAELTEFALPWGQFHVDRDRIMITATQEPLIRAFDFFVKTFQFLPETPIRAIGINRDVHFDAGSSQALDRMGDTLAPKDFWGDFVRQGDRKIGGLRTLIMEQA